MPDIKLRTLLPLLALVSTLAACADGPGTITPPVGLPISSGTWYMHEANAEALPARISDRFIGVVYEEIFVDSARFEIDAAAGTWEQRFWTRVDLQQVEDRRDFVFDQGTFFTAGSVYTFTSTVRQRAFNVQVAGATQLLTDETMAFHTDAPRVLGLYRTTAP